MDENQYRVIEIEYRPRTHQKTIHDSLQRWNVLVCHRRFGKTVLAVNELLRKAIANPLSRPRYAYMAPLLKQAKQIAWDYIKHYTKVIPDTTYNETELRCDLPNGARIQLLGADNPDGLRGIYLDGVVMDEYAQMNPRVFAEIIRPALTDRQGWCVFSGTPQGKNHFFDLWNMGPEAGWYKAMFKASDTRIVPDEELRLARRVMTEEQYEQEWECSFSAGMVGAYYARLIERAEQEGRIRDVPWDPNLPVYTIWDLGVNDTTAIGFVQEDMRYRMYRFIDCYETNGQGADHYAKYLKDKPYLYGAHFLPHDAEVQDWSSGISRKVALLNLGVRPIHIVPKININDGIDAVRRVLPVCFFDKTRCSPLIEAMRSYRKEYDEDNKVFKNRPLHDWSSNFADMMRYFATGFRTPRPQLQQHAHMAFDPYRHQRLPQEAEPSVSPFGRR